MDWIGLGIGIGAAALVAFTIIFNVVRKKKGKSSCGCDGCAGCGKGGCPPTGEETPVQK